MIKTAKLGNEFWVRALHTAFYISNSCLTVNLPKGKTPSELFFGETPDLSSFKIFECTAFKQKKHQAILSDKVTKEVSAGFSEDSEAYTLYNPYSEKTSFSRNVFFNETSFHSFAAHPSRKTQAFVTEKPAFPVLLTETLNDFETETTPSTVDAVSFENIDAIESSNFSRSRSERGIKPSGYLDEYVPFADDSVENPSYREAMKSSLKCELIEPTRKEYNALIENKTWVLSPSRKAIGNRWVFKVGNTTTELLEIQGSFCSPRVFAKLWEQLR